VARERCCSTISNVPSTPTAPACPSVPCEKTADQRLALPQRHDGNISTNPQRIVSPQTAITRPARRGAYPPLSRQHAGSGSAMNKMTQLRTTRCQELAVRQRQPFASMRSNLTFDTCRSSARSALRLDHRLGTGSTPTLAFWSTALRNGQRDQPGCRRPVLAPVDPVPSPATSNHPTGRAPQVHWRFATTARNAARGQVSSRIADTALQSSAPRPPPGLPRRLTTRDYSLARPREQPHHHLDSGPVQGSSLVLHSRSAFSPVSPPRRLVHRSRTSAKTS